MARSSPTTPAELQQLLATRAGRAGRASHPLRDALVIELGDLLTEVKVLQQRRAAIALAEAQRTGQLHTALRNRDIIGQVKGILVERHRITADEAFGLLVPGLARRHTKLTAVAQHLTETGELLSAPRPER